MIGEISGSRTPNEIVLVTAHLDDRPGEGNAPGADDNASGCAAALLAAYSMQNYQFDRTLRFVFFTGEEQGLLGSAAYARSVADQRIIAIGRLRTDPDTKAYVEKKTAQGHSKLEAIGCNPFPAPWA